MKNLQKICAKPSEIENYETGLQLKDLNLDCIHHLLPEKEIEIAFEVEEMLRCLGVKDIVPGAQIFPVRKEIKCLMVTIRKRFFKGSLRESKIMRPGSIVERNIMMVRENSVLLKRMTSLLLNLMLSNIASSSECSSIAK